MVKSGARKERTSSGIAKNITGNIQIFPDDESFNCPKIKGFEGIIDSETIFAGVLTNLVEVPLNELLLLDEFDIGKGFSREFDRLNHMLRYCNIFSSNETTIPG